MDVHCNSVCEEKKNWKKQNIPKEENQRVNFSKTKHYVSIKMKAPGLQTSTWMYLENNTK